MPGGTNGDEAIKHVGKRRVRCAGRFFPQGAGAIVNANNQGKKGWTVVWTSTGLFTITLLNRWMKVVPLGLGLQLAAAADRKLQWGVFTQTATGWTVQVRCVDSTGTVQDIAANAANSIGFDLEFVQDTVAG